jgi:predicted permease
LSIAEVCFSIVEVSRAQEATMRWGRILIHRFRSVQRVTLIQDFLADLRYAGRVFTKSPGFALTAVLSLALGTGANTAIFSLVDIVMLRTLPVREPRQLVELGRRDGDTLSYPIYEIIRARNEAFSGVMLLSAGRYAASARLGAVDAGDVRLSPVSGDYFAVLGVAPSIGRLLTEGDLPASNTAVITDDLWQRAFARDPAIVGQVMQLGDRSYTIVGVGPAGFTGVSMGQPVDVFVPITRLPAQSLKNAEAMMFRVIARLKPGVSPTQALANLELLSQAWSAEFGWNDQPTRISVSSASGGLTRLRRRFGAPLLVLMTVVGLLLLMAAVNVANLLLARASARQREMAVRLSLGAGRGRLIRQLLTESLVLGSAGAALGLLLAPSAAAFLVRFLSSAVGAIELPSGVDARMLTFTIVVSIATVMLFGLAPALAASRVDLLPLFKGAPSLSPGGSGRGRVTQARTRNWLVIAQVSLSCVLLMTAILFARSLHRLATLDAGFRPENVLLLSMSARGLATDESVRVYTRVLDRLARTPGVVSAALSSENLFSGNAWTEPITVPGDAPRPGERRDAVLLVVSPGFFKTMGTPLQRGRDFDLRDDARAPRVAIVNESTARVTFGTSDVIGRTLQVGDRFSSPLMIVGLVPDAKYRTLREPATPMVYLSAFQTTGPLEAANVAVRTMGEPEGMTEELWKAARAESAALRLGGVTTQARLVSGSIAQDRMLAQLSGFFGLTAAALVCLGLYGLTAYDVARRTSEIGIRLALGAQRADVVRLVVRRSLKLVVVGVIIGLGAALLLGRVIERLLFGVRGTDPSTILLSVALLLTVCALAAYGPARRAARVDPLASIRHE